MLVNVCGVDMNEVDGDGNTCCHNAVWKSSAHSLRWLIDAGADFDVANRSMETPLHLTADRTDSDVDVKCMCLLLAAGANVHAKCDDGSTALHLFAFIEHAKAVEAVHLLLAAGADLDAVDNDGVTPRQVLSERDDVVEIDPAKIETARRRIAATQLDFVRNRAIQVCIGLQSLQLDALQMCEICSIRAAEWRQLSRFINGGRLRPPRSTSRVNNDSISTANAQNNAVDQRADDSRRRLDRIQRGEERPQNASAGRRVWLERRRKRNHLDWHCETERSGALASARSAVSSAIDALGAADAAVQNGQRRRSVEADVCELGAGFARTRVAQGDDSGQEQRAHLWSAARGAGGDRRRCDASSEFNGRFAC